MKKKLANWGNRKVNICGSQKSAMQMKISKLDKDFSIFLEIFYHSWPLDYGSITKPGISYALLFLLIPGTNGFLCRSSAVYFERFELDGLS